MTEAELLSQLNELGDSIWSLIQWWASISFGLLALTNFFGRQLKLAFVVVILALYVTFSLAISGNFLRLSDQLVGVISSLATLDANVGLSEAGKAALGEDRNFFLTAGVWFVISVIGTFLGTISYVIFGYLKAHKEP